MIDVRPLRAAIAAAPGTQMQVDKQQLLAMLDEIDIGNSARRTVANARSLLIVNAAISGARVSSGYPTPKAPTEH